MSSVYLKKGASLMPIDCADIASVHVVAWPDEPIDFLIREGAKLPDKLVTDYSEDELDELIPLTIYFVLAMQSAIYMAADMEEMTRICRDVNKKILNCAATLLTESKMRFSLNLSEHEWVTIGKILVSLLKAEKQKNNS